MSRLLAQLARDLRKACVDCGRCVERCAFLGRHGTPGRLAADWLAGQAGDDPPFLCSLCGLCQAVCPTGARPPEFFEAWRAQAAPGRDWRPYRALLGYQARGAHPAFSHHLLPDGCDAVFFPGCALPGQRPDLVWRTWRRLAAARPGVGLALDCCWRPSAMLGRHEEHQAGVERLTGRLTAAGVREIWAACPNCLRSLRQGPAAAAGLAVRDVYGVLLELAPPAGGAGLGAVSLHDPCASRFDPAIQAAARGLVAGAGRGLVELGQVGRDTVCCGEGGAVEALAPELARTWLDQRRAQLDGLPLVTYCAGCLARYRRAGVNCRHLLEMVLEPAPRPRAVAWPPLAYLNRHRLVRRLRRLGTGPTAARTA